MLKGQMAQNISQQMMQQAQGMSSEDMAAMREMMRQLNQMMRTRWRGGSLTSTGLCSSSAPCSAPTRPRASRN